MQIIALPSLLKLLADRFEQLKLSQATHFDISDIKFRVFSLGIGANSHADIFIYLLSETETGNLDVSYRID